MAIGRQSELSLATAVGDRKVGQIAYGPRCIRDCEALEVGWPSMIVVLDELFGEILVYGR